MGEKVDLKVVPWLADFGADVTIPDPVVMDGMQQYETRSGLLKCRANLFNVNHVLMNDERYQDRLRYDSFAQKVMVGDAPLTDPMCTQIALDLAGRYEGLDVSTRLVYEGIQHAARVNQFHPVREYLTGLEWDGVERVRRLWLHYFTAETASQNEAVLMEDIAECFMISAVARVMQPGCKVDTTPILYGGQGRGKSTAVRMLAGDDWFSDTPLMMGSKDFYQQIHGVWLYEIAELDSFRKAENTQIKALLTSTCDRYRPPYDKVVVTQPRQTVFIGTTNHEEFLRDDTGSRRFWPIEVGEIRMDHLKRDRDQLWAEAVQLFKSGKRWWLEEAQARDLRAMSARFRETDAWEEKIAAWLATCGGSITTTRILEEALTLNISKATKREQNRVGYIMRSLGYRQTRKSVNGSRIYVWEAGLDL